MDKYPFFLIVDDGGFPFAGHKNQQRKVRLESYVTILQIAKEFGLRIPICFTLQYLDKRNVTRYGGSLDYLDALTDFLKENHDHIEVGYHGLTHAFNNHVGEFFCLDTNEPVPPNVQREHLEMSAEIFIDLGLPFPSLFVPPSHAWQSEVTDRLVSEFGVRDLVSFPTVQHDHRLYRWEPSKWVRFLPREHLGIYSYHLHLDGTRLDMARRLSIPRSILDNFRLRRSFFNRGVHSYMFHIGNFFPESYGFWKELLRWAIGRPRIELCKSNESAIALFLKDRR